VVATLTQGLVSYADIAWSPSLGRGMISTSGGAFFTCGTNTLGTWEALAVPGGAAGGNLVWVEELQAFVGVSNGGDGKRQGHVSRDGLSLEERAGGGGSAAYESMIWSRANKTLFAGSGSYLGSGVPLIVLEP
jgi:hypothetical protein